MSTCACCEGKGRHPVHYHGGPNAGWRWRPCVLCNETGQVEPSEEMEPPDDKALLALRRRCCKLHFGIKD